MSVSFISIKTERFLEITINGASRHITENIPIVASIFKKGNGIPNKCYVIKAQITGNHVISFRGTNKGWSVVTMESGSIKIDTRIEFGDDIAQHVLFRFVLYKKDGNQIVPLAQALWPLELRSTKSNNKKAEGDFDAYDERHLEAILTEDFNSFQGHKNHQRSLKNKRKGGTESSKRKKRGKTNEETQSYSSDSATSPPQCSPVLPTVSVKPQEFLSIDEVLDSLNFTWPVYETQDFPLIV